MEKITQFTEWLDNESEKRHTADAKKYNVHFGTIDFILKKAREIEAGGFPRPQEKSDWIPTEGEEIEVSDDGIKWDNRKFLEMSDKYFRCRIPDTTSWVIWKFARPLTVGNCSEIPNSGIELPPEYKMPIFLSSLDTQIQELTKSLREVIEVVNKLNNK